MFRRQTFFYTIVFILCISLSSPTQANSKESILFIGSSSIAQWKTLDQDFPEFHNINKGVGGRTYRSLARTTESIARQNPAENIVLYAGDNDVSLFVIRSAQKILEDFKATISSIRIANQRAPIYVIAVKPSHLRRHARRKIQEVNELIQREVESKDNIYFVDVYQAMHDQQGNLRSSLYTDGLHLTKKGYAIWTKKLREAMGLLH